MKGFPAYKAIYLTTATSLGASEWGGALIGGSGGGTTITFKNTATTATYAVIVATANEFINASLNCPVNVVGLAISWSGTGNAVVFYK